MMICGFPKNFFLSLILISFGFFLAAVFLTLVSKVKLVPYFVALFLIYALLVPFLIKFKKKIFYFVFSISAFCISLCWYFSISLCSSILGFYSFFLSLYFLVILGLFFLELQKSYFDPKMAWYEGFPRSIPSLKCVIKNHKQQKELDVQVCRFDVEGACIFSRSDFLFFENFQNNFLELDFSIGSEVVSCFGKAVISFSNGNGIGVQFFTMKPDLRKKMSDFFEELKGKGYV